MKSSFCRQHYTKLYCILGVNTEIQYAFSSLLLTFLIFRHILSCISYTKLYMYCTCEVELGGKSQIAHFFGFLCVGSRSAGNTFIQQLQNEFSIVRLTNQTRKIMYIILPLSLYSKIQVGLVKAYKQTKKEAQEIDKIRVPAYSKIEKHWI